MIIGIRQWNVEYLGNRETAFTVNSIHFHAEFNYYAPNICVYRSGRLVTVIPNKATDTDTADKLINDAFRNNPALRYLVSRTR